MTAPVFHCTGTCRSAQKGYGLTPGCMSPIPNLCRACFADQEKKRKEGEEPKPERPLTALRWRVL